MCSPETRDADGVGLRLRECGGEIVIERNASAELGVKPLFALAGGNETANLDAVDPVVGAGVRTAHVAAADDHNADRRIFFTHRASPWA
jgi:hypothetical protein